MSAKLAMARSNVSEHMLAILNSFLPGAKITVIVRPTIANEDGSRDFLMTDDDLDEVANLVDRRRGARSR